jgi:hypothetical protein
MMPWKCHACGMVGYQQLPETPDGLWSVCNECGAISIAEAGAWRACTDADIASLGRVSRSTLNRALIDQAARNDGKRKTPQDGSRGARGASVDE